MVKRLFWKAPAMLAVFCLAFVLVLTGCDGTGSPANNNNGGGGIENGGGNNGGGGGNDNNGDNGNGGNGQQPPANAFTFDGETTPLNFAAFSTDWYDTPYEPAQNCGFMFRLSKTEGISPVIFIEIPFALMGQEIHLNEGFGVPGGWIWILTFISGEGDIYQSRSLPSETTTGTMRVDRTDTYTFSITIIDTKLDGKPFSAHFYGEFEHKTHNELVFD